MNTKSLMVLLTALVAVGSVRADDGDGKEFRVCRDPNNLPISNANGEGFEDKIAKLLADDLGEKLVFYDFASRFNFIRNTIKFKLPGEDYHCDVVLGVPEGFDQVATTKPYYRSTYALVIPQGRKLDSVKTVKDFLALPKAQLDQLHIGVMDRSPASAWLARHDLVDQGVPYKLLLADLSKTPAGIVEKDLVDGKLDAAILWGPLAGYYSRRPGNEKFTVIPMASEPDVKFDYAIAMGVRYGEKDWKQSLEKLTDRNHAKILAILADYGVPLVDESASASGH